MYHASIPREEEISFYYQILQYGLQNHNKEHDGYFILCQKFFRYTNNYNKLVEKFSYSVVKPFYDHIENYLTKLQIDIGEEESNKITIHFQGDNYGDHMGVMNTFNQNNSSFGVGINKGTISTEKLAATINTMQTSDSSVSQLGELLDQLKTAIETEPALPVDDKEVALQQVAVLASEGQNPKKEKGFTLVKTAIAALRGTASALPSATKFITEVNKVLPLIDQFFGLG